MSSTDTAALLSEVDQLLDSLDLPDEDPNQSTNHSAGNADSDWSSYFGGDSNSSFDLGGDNLSIDAPHNQLNQFDANAEFDSIINGSSSFSPSSYTSPHTVALSDLTIPTTVPHADLRSPLPAYLNASPSPTAATAGDSSIDNSSLHSMSSNTSRTASPYSPAFSSSSHDQSQLQQLVSHSQLSQQNTPLTSPPSRQSACEPSPAHGTAHFNTHAVLSPSVTIGHIAASSPHVQPPTSHAHPAELPSSPEIAQSSTAGTESDPFASYFGSNESNDMFGAAPSHDFPSSFAQSSSSQSQPTNRSPQSMADLVDSYFSSNPAQESQSTHSHQQYMPWESPPVSQTHIDQPVVEAQQKTEQAHVNPQHVDHEHSRWPDQPVHQPETASTQPPDSHFNSYFDQSSENQFDASINRDFMQSASQPPQEPASHSSTQSSPYQTQQLTDYSHNTTAPHNTQSISTHEHTLDEFDSAPLSNAAAEDFLSYNPHAHRSISQSVNHSMSQSAITDMKPVELNTSPRAYDAYQPPLRSPAPDSAISSFQQPQSYHPPTDVHAPLPTHSDPSSRPYTRPPPHPIVSFGFGGRLVVTFPRMIRPFAAPTRQLSAGSQDGYEVNNGQSSGNNTITSVRAGTVRIIPMSMIAEKSPILAPLSSYPGPLSKLKAKDKPKVRSFIDHVSEQYAERPIMTSSHAAEQSVIFSELSHRIEASRLLWRALDILVDRFGNDGASDLTRSFVDLLTKPAHSRSEQSSNAWEADDQTSQHSAPGLLSASYCLASSPSSHSATVADSLVLREKRVAQHSALAAFPAMLLQGRKREAIELALRHELFDHALMLARDDDAMSKHVTSTICRSMDGGSLLRTLYLVGAGMESQLWSPLLQSSGQSHDAPLASVDGLFAAFPAQTKSITAANTSALISSWRTHVALCLSNPSPGNASFLQHMGDYLWAMLDQPVAAHCCYLVSGHMSQIMGSVPTPNTRVVLIGADHRRRLRLLADEEHLMATEIFEYSKGADMSVGSFPYQFTLASRLSDLGSNDAALRYCEELNTAVKATLKRESQSNNQVNSSSLNPLFIHQLSIFEHRLRVLLNAPATAPVSAKLVNGLFSVLDKGINMLVGQEAAHVSNSAGTESRSQWGEGGVGWERKVMNKPLSASPQLQPSTASHSIRAPSPVPMHSLDHSPVPNHLSRPSTARMQSGDSLASSASGGMTLSRSGEIPSHRTMLSHQLNQSHGVLPALAQAGFQPVEQLPTGMSMTRPDTGRPSTPQRTPSHDVPAQQYHTQSYQPNVQSPPQPMPTQPSPAAPQTDSTNQADGKPGIIKRLGSVGGLFKIWGGAEKKTTTKEANLDEDHTFTWDPAQQKYVFRDKDGNEVAEKTETETSVSKPGPPPPTVTDDMKQRWAAAEQPLPPPPSGPSLPPPMMGGANLFAKKGAAVMNRYALSVGSEFTAPDTGPAPVMFQPQFANDFSALPSQPAQFYKPSMPLPAQSSPPHTAHLTPATSHQSAAPSVEPAMHSVPHSSIAQSFGQSVTSMTQPPSQASSIHQVPAQMHHPPVVTPSRPPTFQPPQRSSPGAPAAFVPQLQYGQQQFVPAQPNSSASIPGMPPVPMPSVPHVNAMPPSSARPMPHYPQRPPPQY